MDYNSLVLQIQQYANRNDTYFVEQIPNFITQGINRIYSEAKSVGFELNAGDNLIVGNNTSIGVPANLKEIISLVLINRNVNPPPFSFLLPRSLETAYTIYPSPAVTGFPEFYSLVNYDTIYVFPTPDSDYQYILNYRGLPLFNDANPQNFLTQRYPNLLLYASMMEAIPFLKDDERVPVFESYYNRELQNVNRDFQTNIIDRTSKRDVN